MNTRNLCAVAAATFVFAAACAAQPAPTVLAYGTIGASYSATVSAPQGGSGSYHYSISTGILPPGLSISDQTSQLPNTGLITGVPTTGGTYVFTVKVFDNQSTQSTASQYSIGVMQITNPASLPGATQGSPYTLQFNAADAPAPYVWSIPGPPPGLTINGNTGVLSGVPTQPGTFTFNVSAISQSGNASALKACTLVVSTSLGIVTGSPLPSTYVGTTYPSVTFTASGGKSPYTWAVTNSQLPAGLTLNSRTGVLSGSVTQSGQFNFNVQVTDTNGAAFIETFLLTAYAPLSFTTTSPLPSGNLSVAYKQTLQAAGGLAPYTFGILPSGLSSGVPPGLNLAPSGALTGTPTLGGVYNFIVQLIDANNAKLTNTFFLTINQISIATPSPLPQAAVGAPYTQTIGVNGGTAPLAFAVTAGTLPSGVNFSPSGVLAGTPAVAGTFNFTVTVTDNASLTASQAFQLVVAATGTTLQTSASTLIFSSVAGGDSPPPQYVVISSPTGASVNFTVTIDNGNGGAAPPWITVTPKSASTPARLTVAVDPLALGTGSLGARIRIQVQGTSTFLDISVTHNVAAATPDVIAYPTYLRFSALANNPSLKEQSLLVVNRGSGGSQPFQMSVTGQSNWLSITPSTGTTTHNAPAIILVKVNSVGLLGGLYRDTIHFVSPSTSYDIPVTVYVAPPGPQLGLSDTGLQFQVKQGAGGSDAQTVKIFNLGDPGSSFTWRADVVQGANWVSVTPASGVTQVGQPSLLTIVPGSGAANLPPGGTYALIQISDSSGASTPQFITAVLDVADAGSLSAPDLSPGGLVFRTVPGAAATSQNLKVYTSDLDGAAFQASSYTGDGSGWLSISPVTGVSSTRNPAIINVTANPGSLKPGVYRGEVAVSMPGGVRIAMVTLVISNKAPTGAAPGFSAPHADAACTPTQLAVTDLSAASGFTIKAGWPLFLYILLYDDCNNPIMGADVVASFSNGDFPLTLFPDPVQNLYSTVWQPGSTSSSTVVTFTANAGDLQTTPTPGSNAGRSAAGGSNAGRDAGAAVNLGVVQLNGAVVSNPIPPPALNACGVANNTNVVSCAGVAPGTVSSVYGSNLAPPPAVSPGILPLPLLFNGTQVLVGGIPAPMFYLGPNQINIEVPTELRIGKQYEVLVATAGGVTVAEPITIMPVSPGVAALIDGTVIAQHGDGTLVNALKPAKPGETIAMYLTGLGATNPAVATGAQASLNFLTPVTTPVTVSVDSLPPVTPAFAGLTPGGIGLYQINFQIPANARTGVLNVVVAQGGVIANVTKITVSP